MRLVWVVVGLALAFGQPAEAADCKPRNLTEYFYCQKVDDAERVLKVFRTAGEASSYWPCLQTEVNNAGKQAEVTKNLIDTEEELNRVILNAQAACDGRFSAFKAALLKEADDKGYDNDIKSDDELRFFVFQLWFAALSSS